MEGESVSPNDSGMEVIGGHTSLQGSPHAVFGDARAGGRAK